MDFLYLFCAWKIDKTVIYIFSIRFSMDFFCVDNLLRMKKRGAIQNSK